MPGTVLVGEISIFLDILVTPLLFTSHLKIWTWFSVAFIGSKTHLYKTDKERNIEVKHIRKI